MSSKALTWAWSLTGLTPNQKLVLVSLADNANDDGVCWPSKGLTAAKTGLGMNAVRANIAALEQRGLLRREQRWRDNGSKSTMLYSLDLSVTADTAESAQTERGTARQRAVGHGSAASSGHGSAASRPEPTEGTKGLNSFASQSRCDDLPVVHAVGSGGERLVRKVEEALKAGRKSWDLPAYAARVWDELGEPGDLQPRIRFIADYINIMDDGTENIDFRRIGRLVKRWGKVALRGIDISLAKGDLDGAALYNYSEKVCQEASKRISARREEEQSNAQTAS